MPDNTQLGRPQKAGWLMKILEAPGRLCRFATARTSPVSTTPGRTANPAHLFNPNLSLNRSRITMTFPAARRDGTGGHLASLVVMLNCGTPEVASALVLREDKPSIWSKMWLCRWWRRWPHCGCAVSRTGRVHRAREVEWR